LAFSAFSKEQSFGQWFHAQTADGGHRLSLSRRADWETAMATHQAVPFNGIDPYLHFVSPAKM
jgi:hypothetical protein